MRQVAPRGTVNLVLLSVLLPRSHSFSIPYSGLPRRSFYIAISRSHATLVTNLNCSTSKVNALILPAGQRRGARGSLFHAALVATPLTLLRSLSRSSLALLWNISAFHRSSDLYQYLISYASGRTYRAASTCTLTLTTCCAVNCRKFSDNLILSRAFMRLLKILE